jgi:hypothetical protein
MRKLLLLAIAILLVLVNGAYFARGWLNDRFGFITYGSQRDSIAIDFGDKPEFAGTGPLYAYRSTLRFEVDDEVTIGDSLKITMTVTQYSIEANSDFSSSGKPPDPPVVPAEPVYDVQPTRFDLNSLEWPVHVTLTGGGLDWGESTPLRWLPKGTELPLTEFWTPSATSVGRKLIVIHLANMADQRILLRGYPDLHLYINDEEVPPLTENAGYVFDVLVTSGNPFTEPKLANWTLTLNGVLFAGFVLNFLTFPVVRDFVKRVWSKLSRHPQSSAQRVPQKVDTDRDFEDPVT